jgi:hypothetical protein
MKTALAFLVSAAVLFTTNILHAQLQLSSDDLATIEATTPLPADEVPAIGTYYSAANPQYPPIPGNLLGLSAWNLEEAYICWTI